MAQGVAVIVPLAAHRPADPHTHATAYHVLVLDGEGRMQFSSSVSSVNIPQLVVRPDGQKAIILADPQVPGESATNSFVLEEP